MKYTGLLYFGLMLLTVLAQGAPMPTVKFTPLLRIYECPPVFKHKSECLSHEKRLAPVKLWLSVEVLNQVMGHWTHQETAPALASFHVIVLRGLKGNTSEYSVSAEAGLTGAPMPLSNSRVEFTEATLPKNFGVSSPPVERDGKKYITEIRLEDFHGRLLPAGKP